MIEPFNDYVLLLVPDKSKTESGILLVDSAIEDVPQIVEVAKVGAGTKLGLIGGDTVFIRTYGWEKFTEDKKKYLLGKEENVLGKVV